MSLRIIGGEYRSRVLQSVGGLGTRPLLGQVREALFNILGERIGGALVWDLFAGSGASGIESLSRGAARVLFVEKDNRALQFLRRNLDSLGESALSRSVVVRADAWSLPAEVDAAPDIVFLDPPYAMVSEDPVKSQARARALLDRTAAGGCVLFHFATGVLDADDFDSDLDVDLREWGGTAIAILWRKGEAPAHLQRRWAKARGESVDEA